MKIVLSTALPVSAHYLSTLVLLFRPVEKFGAGDDRSTLSLTLYEENETFFGKATLFENGKTFEKAASAKAGDYAVCENPAKVFAGNLIVALFSEHDGYAPPWGILTGVRPARFALDFLQKGFSHEKTAKILSEIYKVRPEKAALSLSVADIDLDHLKHRKEKTFGLYIGIPFCPTRCRYCSFTSYATPSLAALLPDYLTRLCEEVRLYLKTARELSLSLCELYIGGGTPSVLSEKQLEQFFSELLPLLSYSSETLSEFTFEAGRPDTVTEEKLKILRGAGIGRVSINTQTTNDAILCAVGRGHTARDYFSAFEKARKAGFASINTDLIAGLPGESVESFEKSLCDVLSLEPENITVHAFTLKRSSEYTVGGKTISPSDPTVLRMLSFTEEKMRQNGYFPYYMYRQKNTGGNLENVGYAKTKDAICRYNIDMMEEFRTVLAAGAGASSKLAGKDIKTVKKLHNPKYPYEYLKDNTYMLKNREEILRFYAEEYSALDS